MIKLLHKKKKGFTLIELLVVIAIITILAAILLPALLRARARARYGRWTAGIRASTRIDPNCALYFTFEREMFYTIHEPPAAPTRKVKNLAEAFAGRSVRCFALGLDGIIVGNPQLVPGRLLGKTALEFDGTSTWVVVEASRALTDAALEYTVEVWIKPQVDGDFWTGVVGRRGRNFNFWLGASNNPAGGFVHHRFRTGASTSTGPPDTPRGSIPMNQWSHVVLVNDGETAWTFINGEIRAQGTFPGELRSNHTPLNIGRNLDQTAIPGPAANVFRGIICEVAIFNRALSSDEIRTRFEGGRP